MARRYSGEQDLHLGDLPVNIEFTYSWGEQGPEGIELSSPVFQSESLDYEIPLEHISEGKKTEWVNAIAEKLLEDGFDEPEPWER